MFKKILFLALVLNHSTSLAQFGGPTSVKVATAKQVEMAPVRKIPASVEAKINTSIKAESGGVIDFLAELGTLVKSGETIAELSDTQSALRKQELRNAVVGVKARFQFLESENVRLKDLMKRKLISNSALEQNQSNLDSAKSELAQARSRLNQYQDQVNKLRIVAPFDGYVLQHHTQQGELLNNGSEVVDFISLNELEIEVNVPMSLRRQIQIGNDWQIQTQNNTILNAVVSRYVPVATGQSRTIKTYLEIKTDELWPGESINVLVPTKAKKQVLAVPRDALVIRRNEIYLFTNKENKAHKVSVELGISQGDLIEVKGEISEGDQVVIRGNERLQPMADLKVLE